LAKDATCSSERYVGASRKDAFAQQRVQQPVGLVGGKQRRQIASLDAAVREPETRAARPPGRARSRPRPRRELGVVKTRARAGILIGTSES